MRLIISHPHTTQPKPTLPEGTKNKKPRLLLGRPRLLLGFRHPPGQISCLLFKTNTTRKTNTTLKTNTLAAMSTKLQNDTVSKPLPWPTSPPPGTIS